MGKKKKSKGSKLLKMSDEEKARYLQHKIEQEEEAKRRREQLVKGWMMKKIKREQAFARLNLAKINTFWHQFLRNRKVKEMKEDVGHLQERLDYLLTLKNRIINNLMEELDEAESQYSYNFKAHSIHIDNLTEFHNSWVSELQKLFNEDRKEMVELNARNMEQYQTRSRDNSDYLKTILFAQNKNAQTVLREEYEYYMMRNYEVMKNNEETLLLMSSSREAACTALWRRIAHSVKQYVKRTDTRRHHMAELRRMDAESAIVITENQERIKRLEDLINQLKKQYNTMVKDNEVQLKQLKSEEKNKSLEVIRKRKHLMKYVKMDNKKITLQTSSSNDCLVHMNKNLRLLEHCQFLFYACRKYETQTEKLNKWLNKEIGLKYPYIGLPRTQEASPDMWEVQEDEIADDFILEGTKLFSKVKAGEIQFEGPKIWIDTKKIIHKIFPFKKTSSKRSSAPPKLQLRSGKVRPETSVSKKSKISSASRDLASISTPDKPVVSTLSKVVIQAKPQPSSSSSDSSIISSKITEEIDEEDSKSVPELDMNIGQYGKLHNFWNLHSKVVVDIRDLKEEKLNLMYHNERLKALLRLVLEAAALQGGLVELDTESTVSSSLRSCVSANLKPTYG